MIIKIEDLQVGDEFLIGSNSHFKMMKLIRPMKMSKNRASRRASARCATNVKTIPGRARYDWKTKISTPTTKKVFICSDDYNMEVYIDLNWKDIWLIKRGGTKI